MQTVTCIVSTSIVIVLFNTLCLYSFGVMHQLQYLFCKNHSGEPYVTMLLTRSFLSSVVAASVNTKQGIQVIDILQ